ERYVDDYVQGRLISIDWGTWAENVASWLYTRGKRKEFLLLRYEDMMQDTMHELTRIAEFLGIEPEPNRLQHAIECSSADRMRELERREDEEGRAHKNRRKDIPFVRVAKSGTWRTSLPENCVRQIEAVWGDLMTILGYELVTVNAPLPVR